MERLCSVAGCTRKGHHRNPDLCHTHYCRLRQTGTTDPRVRPARRTEYSHSGGYVLEYVDSHPLATPGNPHYVYRHRKVFYDAHGDGPFRFHACDKSVDWTDLHVDHLDDDPENNEIENLAASCALCNQARGRPKMVSSKRAAGMLLTAFGRTQCLSEWALEIGISRQSLTLRLRGGWSIQRALSEPRGVFGPRRSSGT